MPHLTLEYSRNIRGRVAIQEVFENLHCSLAEAAKVEIRHFKSRAYCCDDFWIGDGSPGQAFIHLNIRLLDASVTDKQRVTEAALAVLQRHIAEFIRDWSWQLTVDLDDLDRTTYRKKTGGLRA